jgi:hypothetical protein
LNISVTGLNNFYAQHFSRSNRVYLNTIERYAISSDEWEELSFNPSPVVSCMACCSHENLIYFGGGKNVNWSKIADFNTLDVDLGSIVKKAPMLAPRTSHQITVLNGFIYALGGFDQSGILLSCYLERSEPYSSLLHFFFY